MTRMDDNHKGTTMTELPRELEEEFKRIFGGKK